MISMTGFGRASVTTGGRSITVEVRSVNHRNLDTKVRGRLEAACEIEVLRAVRAALRRGSVMLTVSEGEGEGGPEASLPIARVRALHARLRELQQELGLTGQVDLATVAMFLGPAVRGGDEGALSWETIAPAVAEALVRLQATRAREGAALATDVRNTQSRLAELVSRLREAVAPLPTRAARRLQERLAGLGQTAGVDPARLAQEVAFLAEKLDVSEELARLDTHLQHLAELIGYGGEEGVGRKLEFLLQEIGRELNTLGTKSQDADVSALVIDAKTELEKMREQAQNIE